MPILLLIRHAHTAMIGQVIAGRMTGIHLSETGWIQAEALARLRKEHGDGIIAVVSHGDVIKSAICHYAGIPLDVELRLSICPCPISVVAIEDSGPRLLCINDTGTIPITFDGEG